MQRIQSRLRRSRRTQYRPHQLGKSKEAENGRNKRRRNLGMDMPKKQLVAEVLIDLHRRLSTLPTRSHERRMIMQETANLYGVSEQTLYRALAQRARPRALRRSDRGTPRVAKTKVCATAFLHQALEGAIKSWQSMLRRIDRCSPKSWAIRLVKCLVKAVVPSCYEQRSITDVQLGCGRCCGSEASCQNSNGAASRVHLRLEPVAFLTAEKLFDARWAIT